MGQANPNVYARSKLRRLSRFRVGSFREKLQGADPIMA